MYNKLFEDPDESNVGKHTINYCDDGAYPFSYIKKKMYIGKEGKSHIYVKLPDKTNYSHGDVDGRVWIHENFISFWDLVSKEDILKIYIELDKQLSFLDDISEFIFEMPIFDGVHASLTLGYLQFSYDDYPKDPEAPEKVERKEHIVSPLEKKKRNVIPGFGSKRWDDKRTLKFKQALVGENYYPSLNENPNIVIDPESYRGFKAHEHNNSPKRIQFDQLDARPFAYTKDGNMFVGEKQSTHKMLTKLTKEIFDNDGRGKYSGRLFPSLKVITFWQFPATYKDLIKVIKDIEKKIDFHILSDDKWLVEIPADKEILDLKDGNNWGQWQPSFYDQDFVKVIDYRGGHSRSKEYLGQEHIESPMKKKKKLVPKGIGSNQKNGGTQASLKYKYAMHKESFYPSLNENPNAIISPEILKRYKAGENIIPQYIEFDGNFNARPFGYTEKGNIRLGSPGSSHWTLQSYSHENMEYDGRGKNSGRIFPKQKVLSFWQFPVDNKEMIKVIKDIEKKSNLRILSDDEWLIEIPSDKSAFNSIVGKNWGMWKSNFSDQHYVKISDYQGAHTRSPEELAQEHIKSPMLKKKRKVPAGFGSNHPDTKSLKVKQAMYAESVYFNLYESPDGYVDRKINQYVGWDEIDYQPITFGWYADKLIIKEVTKEDDDLAKHRSMIKDGNGDRNDYMFPGRLWKKTKVISFWKFPKKEILPKIIKELSNKLNISINSAWRVNMLTKDGLEVVVPISDYYEGQKVSDKDLAKAHITSPMKKKKKLVPKGIGSNQKNGGTQALLKYKYAMHNESYYPQLF